MAWRRWEGRRCGCWALGREGRKEIEGGGKEGGREGGREGGKCTVGYTKTKRAGKRSCSSSRRSGSSSMSSSKGKKNATEAAAAAATAGGGRGGAAAAAAAAATATTLAFRPRADAAARRPTTAFLPFLRVFPFSLICIILARGGKRRRTHVPPTYPSSSSLRATYPPQTFFS